MEKKYETIMFAAGCFWGVERTFQLLKGVVETSVGYSGGKTKNPTYKEVCTNKTGHAEVVKVKYDPEIISFKQLLKVFWRCHDPTTMNRQGPDIGSQYRSAIFYYTEKQKEEALKSKEEIDNSDMYKDPIVTEIAPAKEFYPAEDYHQNFVVKNPWRPCHVYFAKGLMKQEIDS